MDYSLPLISKQGHSLVLSVVTGQRGHWNPKDFHLVRLLSPHDKVQEERMKTLFETRIYMSIPLSVCRPANTRIINHASAQQTGKLGTQLWLLNERMPPLLFHLFWLEWARKETQRINTTSWRYFWDPSPGLEERQVSTKHCFIQWQQQGNLAKAETVADKVSLFALLF